MTYKIKSMAVAGLLACMSASPVLAQDIDTTTGSGFYFGLQGAVGPALNDVDFEVGGITGITAKFDRARIFGATGGVFLNDNWRVGVKQTILASTLINSP